MHKINGIKTVGIVGGGQLARMMIPAIKQLGLNVAILDPSPDCPCHSISDHHIIAGFGDPDGFEELAKLSDVLTYEFEHIDVGLLAKLEKQGHKIFPSVRSLAIIQDKLTQKQELESAGIAVPKFRAVKDLTEVVDFPCMLKSRRGGYDGKGNFLVRNKADLKPAMAKLRGDLYIEEFVDFDKEISVIATRGQNGECVIYPIAENVHKDSILDTTMVPASISTQIAEKAIDTARHVMECFKGIGTFCVELFVNEKSGEVLVNEVAPRVHNSGHYTIEACRTSQFENHVRAILGVALGSTEMLVPCAAMKNIIGDQVHADFASMLETKNLNVHIYGKTKAAVGRKMGHITITGTMDEVKEKLDRIDLKAVNLKHEN